MKQFRLVNGDLVIGPGGYATVSGTERVIQDLGMMVREAIGTDRFHPRWGTVLDDYVGLATSGETKAMVRSEITRLVQNYIVMQTRQIEGDITSGRRSRYSPEEVVVALTAVEIQELYDRYNVKVTVETQAGETASVVRTVT